MIKFVTIMLFKRKFKGLPILVLRRQQGNMFFLAFDHELYPNMKNPNKIPKEVLSTPLATRRASE